MRQIRWGGGRLDGEEPDFRGFANHAKECGCYTTGNQEPMKCYEPGSNMVIQSKSNFQTSARC